MTQSCRKDAHELVALTEIDPTIEKYFGTWKFTKTEYRNYWDYVPDSTGSSTVVHTLVTEVNWERTGEISMGTQAKELFIQWQANSTIGYYAHVKNDLGHLYCNSDCHNIPYSEGINPGQWSAHHITDSTFRIDLGSYGSGSTVYNWDIKGVKM